MTDREKFEVWAVDERFNVHRSRDDQYVSVSTLDAWAGWQASRQQALEENKEDSELAAVAMRFVDRAGDTCDIDSAERICAEFHAAVSEVVERWHPLRPSPIGDKA